MAKVLNKLDVKELSGKNGLVVFFFPKAMSGPCSIEVHEFNERLDDIKKLGFNVVGISIDDVKSNEEFMKKEGLNYDLVSDSNEMIIKSFKDLGQIDYQGKTITVALRTTFILDPMGKTLATLKDVQPITAASTVISEIEKLNK